MRIGLIVPCYIDAFFPAVGVARFDDVPPPSLLAGCKDSLLRMGNRRYAAFHTGPSATADIEGVLIHGAQGVRSLSVLPVAHVTGRSTQSPETTG